MTPHLPTLPYENGISYNSNTKYFLSQTLLKKINFTSLSELYEILWLSSSNPSHFTANINSFNWKCLSFHIRKENRMTDHLLCGIHQPIKRNNINLRDFKVIYRPRNGSNLLMLTNKKMTDIQPSYLDIFHLLWSRLK